MSVDASQEGAQLVRVAVRVRPLLTRELLQGSRPCISTDGPCVTVGRDRRFTFDSAYGPGTQQEQVYSDVVAPLVESCFDGFNGTVLAYGQTGSGKTFTMGTGECTELQHLGIAPRVIRHVFEAMEARRVQAAFYVRVQFLEIYNEDVKDLLAPQPEQATRWVSRDSANALPGGASGPGSSGITLRDAGDGTIMVIGASEEPAECAEDLEALLERGMAARATSSTNANEQSSRSHAILTIIIEQHLLSTASIDADSVCDAASARSGLSGDGGASLGGGSAAGRSSILAAGEVRTAKLHLVDLAGSERTKQLRSSLQGARFRETVNINAGLLALGNVISALGDERRRGSHVPYRESKLTRLLQDSLGGNSRTAMIACVSPADDVLEETLNTLKYANRARNIRNKPVANRTLPASSLSPLRGAVQEVQLHLLQQLAGRLLPLLQPSSALAQGLPLPELMALDAADPAACLEVLSRMKKSLAAALVQGGAGRGGGGSGEASLAASVDLGEGGAATGAAAAATVAGVSTQAVSSLVAGCSRAIAGILQGLAEMEAQGHVDKEAREHILRSLDASTLGLLPVVRSIGPRASTDAALGPPPAPPLALALEKAAAEGGGGKPAGGTEREKELEERVRALETELAGCRSELKEAREDLDRDEIIFADKLKELQDTKAANEEAQKKVKDAEEKHAKEVEALRKQVAALKRAAAGQSRAASRSSSRPQSGDGAVHRKAERASSSDGGASEAEGDEEQGAEDDEVLYDEELLSYISETDYTEQHQREVLESDVALREELADVLKEKASAEAERAAVERAALSQRSSFEAARAALESQLNTLAGSISSQQQALEAAVAAEREARDLAAQWQERATELESAIEAREEALEHLRSELEAVEGGAAAQRSADERAALREQYEARINAVVTQVHKLQRQLQQHAVEAGASAADRRERQQQAERAEALEAELARLRTQQAELRRQLAERVSRYERDSAARVKELAALRKAGAAAKARMATLEQENRAQRLLLREKQAEVAAAQARLRDSQCSQGSAFGLGPGPGGGARSGSPGRRDYAPGGRRLLGSLPGSPGPNRTSTVPQTPAAPPPPAPLPPPPVAQHSRGVQASLEDAPEADCPTQQQEARGWAAALLGVVAEAAAVEARAEVLAARHTDLLTRREELDREQAAIELRTQRRTEALQAAVAACDAELADLVGRIPSPRYETPLPSAQSTPRGIPASGPGASAGPGVGAGAGGAGLTKGFGGSRALLSDEWVALQQRIADVSHDRAKLEERLRAGRVLDEQEQQVADSLDDQFEDLETQLSYVKGELADRRAELRRLQRRREALAEQVAELGPGGLRVALTEATEAVAQRAYQVRQLESALAASEAGAARREAALQLRLRESLVSLSAHLASLEATSPGSSASIGSTELRTLLGLYLEGDRAQQGAEGHGPVASGSTAAQRSHAQPRRVSSGREEPGTRFGTAGAVSGPQQSTPQPLWALQREAQEVEPGQSGPGPGSASQRLHEPVDLSLSLQALMVPSAAAGFGAEEGAGPGQTLHAQHRQQGSWDGAGPSSSSRTAGADSAFSRSSGLRGSADGMFGTAAGSSHAAASGARASLRASFDLLAGGQVAHTPQRPSAHPAAPQHHDTPQHQQQQQRQAGTPQPGGILRRAGSSDSIGSTGSGSAAKRVTWGAAHPATGAALSGPGASGRERSILDRAGAGWPASSTNQAQSDHGGSLSQGLGPQAPGAAPSTSAPEPSAPHPEAPFLSHADSGFSGSRRQPSSRSAGEAETGGNDDEDDTRAASDGGSGSSGGISKANLCSHDPWSRGQGGKAHGKGLAAREDDLLAAQDSSYMPLSENTSLLSVSTDCPSELAGPPSAWAGRAAANASQVPRPQPVHQQQQQQQLVLAQPHAQPSTPGARGPSPMSPAPWPLPPQQLRAQAQHPPQTQQQPQPDPHHRHQDRSLVGGDEFGSEYGRSGHATAARNVVLADEDEDAELEEQVRLLTQAAAAASAGSRPAPAPPQPHRPYGDHQTTAPQPRPSHQAPPHSHHQHQQLLRVSDDRQPGVWPHAAPLAVRLSAAGPGSSSGGGGYPGGPVDAAGDPIDAGMALAASERRWALASQPSRQGPEGGEQRLEGRGLAVGPPEAEEPPPLPAPVRSTSPTALHYGRPGRATAGPTTPNRTSTAALSEALMPYKAHLRRSVTPAQVAAPNAPGPGPTPGLAHATAAQRAGTPDGRRAGSAMPRAGFASPQQPKGGRPATAMSDAQAAAAARAGVPASWLAAMAAEEAREYGRVAGPVRQVPYQAQPQAQAQQPWRQGLSGGPGAGTVGLRASGASLDERQAAALRAARQRGYLPT
ncbi:hypothetical protein HYH03_002913 [Edaphochlamys debaryana]|uniref:Kinesin motor domain-containing protein n=1 Tax=Edaphochlamys debaryana TaxID=47281 RepID=A0A835YAH8_9CHLO|nr:hypothetical protein HYH03_002913 [Edaphochlamys debaryana]|eukprot:KAG2499337.1 hypothetical protein HYH03_002913 [Edaphochlamys debaryana]